ncbi:MAG: hypothetical protein K6C06_00025, partial [Lachnospiraceae bacterium]|nr:hypothetical protein [Lachnospiraceae bacterium]
TVAGRIPIDPSFADAADKGAFAGVNIAELGEAAEICRKLGGWHADLRRNTSSRRIRYCSTGRPANK